MRRAPVWIAIAGGVVAGGLALDAVGLPSSYLFAALLLGLAIALARPDRVALPPVGFRAAQAVAGVTLGAYLQTDALEAVAGALAPVLLVSAATLGLSLAAGAILSRTTPLDPPTALLGMIAGGASGIVGMSGELGADDRLVAFMQYLRVLVVVLLTPIGIAVLFGGEHGSGGAPPPSSGLLGAPWEWVATAGLALAGAWAAGRLRVTAGVLLGPMIATGALVLAGPLEGFAVPDLLGQAAFALIGLQVGLRFTPETVRLLGRLTLPGAARDRRPARHLLRPRRPARRDHLGHPARLVSRHDARRALRGARGRLRLQRGHDVHRRRADAARRGDGAAGAARRALAAAGPGTRCLDERLEGARDGVGGAHDLRQVIHWRAAARPGSWRSTASPRPRRAG